MQPALRDLHQPEPDLRPDAPELVLPGSGEGEIDEELGTTSDGVVPSIRSIICGSAYAWPCEWALAVVFCESSNDPGAVGREIIDGREYRFVGWFQVEGGPTDPIANTDAAYVQWQQWQRGERPRPWPNCPR